MPIIRRHPRRFTIVPNEIIESDLSFEALGCLTYLLSKPDDWTIRVSELRKRAGVGRDKMQRILRELKDAGMLVGERVRDSKTGRLMGEEYVLYDTPQSANHRQPENPASGKPGHLLNTDYEPITDPIDGKKKPSPSGEGKKPDTRKECSARPKKPKPKDILAAAVGEANAADIIEHRQKLRKPLTARAASVMANQFKQIDISERNDAVDLMLVQGWQGFKADWYYNAKSASESPQKPSRARDGNSGRNIPAEEDDVPERLEPLREALVKLATYVAPRSFKGDMQMAMNQVKIYLDDLDKPVWPPEALAAAIDRMRTKVTFWPTIQEIVEEAKPELDEIRRRRNKEFNKEVMKEVRRMEGKNE
jgi:hypothetical protein